MSETAAKQTSNDELLSRCEQQFIEAADQTTSHRAEAERARDYYDGKQWTTEEIETLRKRRQPIVTDNRIADKVQYLLGLERKTRTDPKAYPRNPSDEGAAEAATDGIRYVFDCNDFQQTRSAVFEYMLIEGCGAAEVIHEGKKEKIRKIRWDRLYWDPHSRELDFSDAQYMGIIAWFDEQRLIARYPGKKDLIEGQMSDAARTYVDTYDDKPQAVRFIDLKRRRIQVFESYFWHAGKWQRAVFMRGAWLEDPKASPYKNEDGEPECAILAQAAYRDRDGNPYGVVRRYRDLQDEINKRRSKSLHALSTRRVIADKGAVDDVNKARVEVQRPDGWLEKTPGMEINVEANADIGMSQFQLLQDALQALSTTGPNAALQGQSGDLSGRAKQLDQEGGAIQIGPLFDQIRHFQKRCARATWCRIRQFWTDETWVRVTDDEQKLKFVGLNVPITAGEQMLESARKQGLSPEQLQKLVPHIAQDPQSQQVVAKRNDVASMDVDVIIEESPDTITLQQEQFGELVALAPQVVFPPEVYIEASGLRNKQRLIEMVKGGGEASPEQQAQQQKAQQLQEMTALAEARNIAADADLAEAQVDKTKVETAVLLTNAAKPELDPPQQPQQQKPPAKKKAATKK